MQGNGSGEEGRRRGLFGEELERRGARQVVLVDVRRGEVSKAREIERYIRLEAKILIFDGLWYNKGASGLFTYWKAIFIDY